MDFYTVIYRFKIDDKQALLEVRVSGWVGGWVGEASKLNGHLIYQKLKFSSENINQMKMLFVKKQDIAPEHVMLQ